VVEADNDSTTYDIEAQCGAGGQPKSDLLSTHTYRVLVSLAGEEMV